MSEPLWSAEHPNAFLGTGGNHGEQVHHPVLTGTTLTVALYLADWLSGHRVLADADRALAQGAAIALLCIVPMSLLARAPLPVTVAAAPLTFALALLVGELQRPQEHRRAGDHG